MTNYFYYFCMQIGYNSIVNDARSGHNVKLHRWSGDVK